MQYYIIDTSYNWADEMDIDCFTFMSEEELAITREALSKIPNDHEYSTYIGSNEEQIFTKEDIEYMLNSAKPISEEEMKIVKRYAGQCEKDPISDYCMSYDDTTDGPTDDDGHPIDNSINETDSEDDDKMYKYENGHLVEVEPNFEYDDNGVEDILTDHPSSISEGMVIYHCWVYGKAWFDEWFVNYDNGTINPKNLLKRSKWYESFKSTVHKDENGFYVYPNDDVTREKYYKFGIDSTSRIVK